MSAAQNTQTAPAPALLPNDAATQDAIKKIKAEYDEKVAALARYYEQDRKQWRAKVRSLASENKLLRHSRAGIKQSADDKDKIIFQITRGGAPSPQDPCLLCGRVGRDYAEDVGERKSHQEAVANTQQLSHPATSTTAQEKSPEEPSIANTAALEHEKRLVTTTKDNGKSWDDSLGTYTLPEKPMPRHADTKFQWHEAWKREWARRPNPGDEELLAVPLESDATYHTGHSKNIMTGQPRKGNDDAAGEQDEDDI